MYLILKVTGRDKDSERRALAMVRRDKFIRGTFLFETADVNRGREFVVVVGAVGLRVPTPREALPRAPGERQQLRRAAPQEHLQPAGSP